MTSLPADKIREHLAEMEDWIAGRRTSWNLHHDVNPDPERRGEALVNAAREDAQHVAMHSEAVRAYAALLGSGMEVAP